MAKTYNTISTFVSGAILTAAQMNQLGENSNNFRVPPACMAYNSATQQLTTATSTAITFNSEYYDTDSIHSTSSNTSRFTLTTAGLYLATANLSWASNGTGIRELVFRLNGTTNYVGTVDQPTISSGACGQVITAIVDIAANDYLEVIGWQSSGGNLNVSADSTSSGTFCRMAVQWIGQKT